MNAHHTYPLDDTYDHDTDGFDCHCKPVKEVHYGELLILHNSYDGREWNEMAQK